ncbi:hypothetical protein FHR83_006370 [Actinoplanes campanulatus]|uniref:Uncharacterized protein n=1 Tax=Actinoplanes campanulatus TaxID=113559 RepID=A0A7W5ALW6_9ACTN|nr:hypothetical protein [Actinoplanes campanulatus]MBB3098671.1 hypothetical protein [Actinoplanes campanulatus]
MTGEAVVQEVGGRPTISWWRMLRIVLVAGWVAWACLAWWAAPREASAAQARADLAGGHVTSYEWGDNWEHDTSLVNPIGERLATFGTAGPVFLWHTDDGRAYYTVVDDGAISQPYPASEDGMQYSGPEAQALGATVQASQDRGSPAEPPTGTILAGVGIAGFLLILGTLIAGPAPVTGTRWFWFFVVLSTPLTLGLFWWLAREHPWSPQALPSEKKRNGFAGFGIALLSGMLFGLAAWGLQRMFGDAVIPKLG